MQAQPAAASGAKCEACAGVTDLRVIVCGMRMHFRIHSNSSQSLHSKRVSPSHQRSKLETGVEQAATASRIGSRADAVEVPQQRPGTWLLTNARRDQLCGSLLLMPMLGSADGTAKDAPPGLQPRQLASRADNGCCRSDGRPIRIEHVSLMIRAHDAGPRQTATAISILLGTYPFAMRTRSCSMASRCSPSHKRRCWSMLNSGEHGDTHQA